MLTEAKDTKSLAFPAQASAGKPGCPHRHRRATRRKSADLWRDVAKLVESNDLSVKGLKKGDAQDRTIFEFRRIVQIIAPRRVRANIASQDRLATEHHSRLNIAQHHVEQLPCVEVIGRSMGLNVRFGLIREISTKGQVVAAGRFEFREIG